MTRRGFLKTRSFLRSERGGILPLFSVLLLPLLGTTAAAVDYGVWLQKKAHLQGVADAAATAGAREFRISTSAAVTQAEQFIAGNVRLPVSTQVTVEESGSALSVRLEHDADAILSGLLGSDGSRIAAAATALANFSGPPCMVALEEGTATGILVQGSSSLIAEGCILWSNSTGHESFRSYPSTRAWADLICAVGAVHARGDVKPDPRAGCKSRENPLANWTPPEVKGPCVTLPKTTGNSAITLEPGRYCGGLTLENGPVELTEGIYIIEDGPFALRGNVEVTGRNVGIYLTGAGAQLDLAGTGRLDVTAAYDGGDMHGLVIAHDPAAPAAEESQVGEESTVIGNFTLAFEGTIYLPKQTFRFWGNSDTTVKPPISYIIANRIAVGGNGTLRLRSDPNAENRPPWSEPMETVRLTR